MMQVYVGESSPLTSIMGIITPTIITLWFAVMGMLLMRKSFSPLTHIQTGNTQAVSRSG
jgi:hypothetical protein